jgi:hypothetical protein
MDPLIKDKDIDLIMSGSISLLFNPVTLAIAEKGTFLSFFGREKINSSKAIILIFSFNVLEFWLNVG